MKKIYLLFAVMISANMVFAQRFDDILKYSRISPDGSARTSAMGNAFGALGGDLSTLHTNPGGLGVFRKSEFSFTPLVNLNKIKSGALSTNLDKFLIGNIGIVFSIPNPRSDWKSYNIGFNYTNLNNYNKKTLQEVLRSGLSQTDIWAWNSGNQNPENLDALTTGLAYDTKIILRMDDEHNFGDPANNGYYSSILRWAVDDELFNQYMLIEEDGYQ